MRLNGVQLGVVFLSFLAVALVIGYFGRGERYRPRLRRRDRGHVLDETGPYEVPEEDAPSRDD